MRLCLPLVAWTLALAQPVPEDGGDQLLRESDSLAWRTEVVAHEAAVAQSVPAVQAAAQAAAASADETAKVLATADGADVKPSLEAATAARDKALAVLQSVKDTADAAEQKAAEVAKAAAEAAVEKIKAEAAAYYKSLEAKLSALAIVPVNPKAEAAQKNAQPYLKAALDTQGMVAMYNLKANNMISGAFGKVQLAHRLANEANADQAAGNVVMANRKMIQAHGLMVTAQLDEDQAKGIFALAREFNQAVPMYQAAGGQAAAAALALPQMRKSAHADSFEDIDSKLQALQAETNAELAQLQSKKVSRSSSADDVPKLRGAERAARPRDARTSRAH